MADMWLISLDRVTYLIYDVLAEHISSSHKPSSDTYKQFCTGSKYTSISFYKKMWFLYKEMTGKARTFKQNDGIEIPFSDDQCCTACCTFPNTPIDKMKWKKCIVVKPKYIFLKNDVIQHLYKLVKDYVRKSLAVIGITLNKCWL